MQMKSNTGQLPRDVVEGGWGEADGSKLYQFFLVLHDMAFFTCLSCAEELPAILQARCVSRYLHLTLRDQCQACPAPALIIRAPGFYNGGCWEFPDRMNQEMTHQRIRFGVVRRLVSKPFLYNEYTRMFLATLQRSALQPPPIYGW